MSIFNSIVGLDDVFLSPDYQNTVQTVKILGLPLHCLDYEGMHQAFDWWLADKTRPALTVALVNVNCSVSAIQDDRIFNCYLHAAIRGIDGMPFLR